MRQLLLFLMFCAFAGSVCAAEPVRRAQEELRRRNLFFGDVDGRDSPSFEAALRLYQAHKGFEPNGKLDPLTARSLGAETGETADVARTKWPDVPVLKSDAARELSPEAQAALAQKAVSDFAAEPSPERPAESPTGTQNLDPQKVTSFVEDYLRENETNDLAAQLKYYHFPVEYFDHGKVDEAFVAKDNRNYMRRWPDRHYRLEALVKFAAGGKEGETVVQFPISFQVRSGQRAAKGKTRNFWTIKSEGDRLKIVSIREQHLRE